MNGGGHDNLKAPQSDVQKVEDIHLSPVYDAERSQNSPGVVGNKQEETPSQKQGKKGLGDIKKHGKEGDKNAKCKVACCLIF